MTDAIRDVLNEILAIAGSVRERLKRAKGPLSKQVLSLCVDDLKVVEALSGTLGKKPPSDRRRLVQWLCAKRLIVKAGAAARELQAGDDDLALAALDDIVTTDTDVDALIAALDADIEANKRFVNAVPDVILRYVEPGMVVCELFHGERTDVLTLLADVVGTVGRVYGIDALNPFADNPGMVKLAGRDNVELVKAAFPSMPVPPLDVLVVRELLWAYKDADDLETATVADAALAGAIKSGGLLILLLNKTERAAELKGRGYARHVARWPGKWTRVSFGEHDLVFRKQ